MSRPSHSDGFTLIGMILSALAFWLLPSIGLSQSLEEGRELFQKGRLKEASETLSQVVANGGENREARLLLAVTLVKLEEFPRAERVLTDASRLLPRNTDLQTLLGWLYLEGFKDPLRAIPPFESAVALSPGSPEVHNNLGTALDRARSYDRAVESYARALALKPSYPEALSNRGWAHFHRKDPVSAEGDFLAALSLRPDDPGALSGLAQVAKGKGELSKAASAYRELLSHSPNFVYLLELFMVYIRQYLIYTMGFLVVALAALKLRKMRRVQKGTG